MIQNPMRHNWVRVMLEYGEISCVGDDFYEDLGGHIIHDIDLDSYIENFQMNLSGDEIADVISSLRESA